MTRAGNAPEVRTAGGGDLLGVVLLHSRSSDLAPDPLSERHQVTWERMLSTAGMTVYVAVAGRDVVGTTTLLVMPNLGYDCHPTAFVEAMVVAESHRRRDAGRRLMARLVDDARTASCRKARLLSPRAPRRRRRPHVLPGPWASMPKPRASASTSIVRGAP